MASVAAVPLSSGLPTANRHILSGLTKETGQ
jgi:hypothetical protein